MKKLSYAIDGRSKVPEWTDKELLDVFITPGGAEGYENVLETLQAEYDRLGAVIDEFKSHAKGAADVVRAAMIYRRILFFKIQALKGTLQVVNAAPTEPVESSMAALSIKDLQDRYGVKSPQGITTWLNRNLDAINASAPAPVQKVGKYWRIPASALPIIDLMRRGGKER